MSAITIEKEEKKERLKSIAGTVLFHLLVLLLLFFLSLSREEGASGSEEIAEGILIDFGNTDKGMGDENALQASQAESNPTNAQDEAATENDEKVHTQNVDPAISISQKSKIKTQPQVTEPQPQPDQNLLSALNALNKTGQGTSNTPGNEGNPEGEKGATGSSEGFSPYGKWKLKESGRKMIGKIEIDYDSQVEGIVAVEITVDKTGRVVRANPVLLGSTTTNHYLWNKAKEGLQGKVLFNQGASGEEARGVIYIEFKLK